MENKIKYTRYWIAIGADKKPIINQVVARTRKPKSGEWLELSLRPCCSIKVVIGTFSSSPIFTINCGNEKVKVSVSGANPTQIIETLNDDFSALGKWSTDGEYFYLKGVFCPNASLELIYN
jgi:hypothetical protein